MKKIVTSFILAVIAAMCSVVFVGCDIISELLPNKTNQETPDNPEKPNDSDGGSQNGEISIFTVSGSTITGLTVKGKKLTTIVIPASINGTDIKAIGESAFMQTGIKNVSFESGTKISEIGENAFYLTPLTEIKFPDTILSVGNNAFGGCSDLKSVSINEGCRSIGGSAFSTCSKLTEVTLPQSLNFLGGGAFSGCTGLEGIIFKNPNGWVGKPNAPYDNADKSFNASDPKQNVYYLAETHWGSWSCDLRRV